jgi:D-glycero-D-manno-heptose 1,7-bisphosphate phosphatase
MNNSRARRAVFLDRDGTLIDDPGYLADPSRIHLIPGAAEALVALESAGFLRIMISNQSGIGRGRYPATEYHATQAEMERQLGAAGATLDAAYHCPHAPDAGCLCRKPGTALHREAAACFDVDLTRSWCVGDHVRDLEAGAELGCRTILVRTGHGTDHVEAAIGLGAAVVDDLPTGVSLISRYT